MAVHCSHLPALAAPPPQEKHAGSSTLPPYSTFADPGPWLGVPAGPPTVTLELACGAPFSGSRNETSRSTPLPHTQALRLKGKRRAPPRQELCIRPRGPAATVSCRRTRHESNLQKSRWETSARGSQLTRARTSPRTSEPRSWTGPPPPPRSHPGRSPS